MILIWDHRRLTLAFVPAQLKPSQIFFAVPSSPCILFLHEDQQTPPVHSMWMSTKSWSSSPGGCRSFLTTKPKDTQFYSLDLLTWMRDVVSDSWEMVCISSNNSSSSAPSWSRRTPSKTFYKTSTLPLHQLLWGMRTLRIPGNQTITTQTFTTGIFKLDVSNILQHSPRGHLSPFLISACREGAKATEPGSSQWCQTIKQEAMGRNHNTGSSTWI